MSLFKRLARLVKPSVISSILHTHWNSWCTRRRFQQPGTCLFGCSLLAEDSLEHYSSCPLIRSFLSTLRLPAFNSMDMFLLLDHRLWSDEKLIVLAIAVHCVYTAFNYVRVNRFLTPMELQDFLQRAAYHATNRHSRSASALAMSMNNSRHGTQRVFASSASPTATLNAIHA